MRTNKITGYFDVKVYNDKKPREQWKIKGSDESISFGVVFDADSVPSELSDYARPYTDKNGNAKSRVTFKISARCRWFDVDGAPMTRPDNSDIDGKRYECILDYRQLNGAEGTKEARGYWVNAIQCREVSTIVFAPMDGDVQPKAEAEAKPAEEKPAEEKPFDDIFDNIFD